ncbi:hypothetical protein FWF89_02805 [Candidatus Saccharibacteria bacterium]|nr:hypothetical protein [Candidatus Saccharibacteria bacterium]
MEKTNFKKWGWWALGGVVAIVVIAVVVAIVGSGPEPTTDEPEGDGQTGIVDEKPSEEPEKPGEVAVEDPGTLPQSGPVEDGMLGLLLAGVFAYVVGLALSSVRRAAKLEKKA